MDPKLIITKSNSSEINMQKSDLESFNYGKNAPPGYEVIDLKNSPTPTSSSLFKSVKYAKDTTRGGFKAVKKMGTFFCCSITIIIILSILMAVPVAMITIGSIYIKDCSMQRMIPIWLIVFGALSLIKNLSTLFQRIRGLRNRDEHSSSTLLNVFDSFMALFLIIWFVCGNIWVYSNYNKIQYKNPTDTSTYCGYLVFYFTFWIITTIYIVIGASCMIFCCTICFTLFLPSKK